MMNYTTVLVWTAVGIITISANADWPQFQGPNRDGVATDTVKLANAWPTNGPTVLWQNEKLGTGYGGAAIESGKVYLLDRVNDRQDVLRCLALTTGAEEWSYAYDAPEGVQTEPAKGKFKGSYNGSRNVPAVDAQNIYALGPFGDLTCLDKNTHKPVWSVNIITTYGAVLGNWGICQSPVLHKNTVIVAPLSKQNGIVAFEKTTGKEIWKSEALGDIAWTSPSISTIAGVTQVVILCNRDTPHLTGVDVTTGRKLWSYNNWKCPNPIASHTDCGAGRFFITGGYRSGCALVKVSLAGNTWNVQEVFKNLECSAQTCKPVFYKDNIYAVSNDDEQGNGLMCLGITGADQAKLLWKAGSANKEEIGSILIADGKIYNFLSEQGILRVVAASPTRFKQLDSAKITQGINMWAPMAISNGKLIIRNKRTLICLNVE